jgi:hypothetical protein
MGNFRNCACLSAASLALLAASALRPAMAGPCSDQIAEVGRALSAHPSVAGSPTTGTLNGSGPDAAKSTAQAPNTAAQAESTTAKGSKLGGDSGNREMNGAASNVATSPEDVRRQQAGVPTMADAPNAASPDGRLAQASQFLDRARALDAKGDPACQAATEKARQLASPG